MSYKPNVSVYVDTDTAAQAMSRAWIKLSPNVRALILAYASSPNNGAACELCRSITSSAILPDRSVDEAMATYLEARARMFRVRGGSKVAANAATDAYYAAARAVADLLVLRFEGDVGRCNVDGWFAKMAKAVGFGDQELSNSWAEAKRMGFTDQDSLRALAEYSSAVFGHQKQTKMKSATTALALSGRRTQSVRPVHASTSAIFLTQIDAIDVWADPVKNSFYETRDGKILVSSFMSGVLSCPDGPHQVAIRNAWLARENVRCTHVRNEARSTTRCLRLKGHEGAHDSSWEVVPRFVEEKKKS